MRVDESASGTEVRLHLRDVLEIVLAENPSTGHGWQVLADGAPASRLLADRFAPGSGALGAAGQRTFTFEAVAPGAASVDLAYARSFEEAEPARRFTIRLVVG